MEIREWLISCSVPRLHGGVNELMLYKTHQAFGLFATSLVLINYTHTPILSAPGILALGVALITSVMPDADEPGSVSAKSLFPLAMTLEMLRVTHRGATHSLLIAGLWFWLAFSSIHWYVAIGSLHFSLYPVLLGAAVAYLSHIVIDLLNKEGEQLFWPFHGRFALYLVSADGLVNAALEYVLLIAFFLVLLYGLSIEFPAMRTMIAPLITLSHFISLK